MTTKNRTGYPEQLRCLHCNRLANTECVEQGHRTSQANESWCECGHAKYNHGEDDFSSQECNVNCCDCENFIEHEPAPRAAERERVILNSDLVVRPMPNTLLKTKYLLATDDGWPIAEFYREEEAEGIAYEHNQHSTLVEQRQWLIETLRDEIHALEAWKKAKGLPIDVADGIAISLSKLNATITTIEQSVKNAGEGEQ